MADELTTSSNVSDANLVRRQPRAVDVHAGFGVRIFSSTARIPVDGDTAKHCTLGFAIRKVHGPHQFDHGFLTLGSCLHSDRRNGGGSVFYNPNQNWVREEAIRLGNVGSLKYEPASGLNYALFRLFPNNNERIL